MPPFMLAVRLSRSHLTGPKPGPEPGPEPKNSVQNRKVKSRNQGVRLSFSETASFFLLPSAYARF